MATRTPTIPHTLATLLAQRGGQTAAELGGRLVELGRTRARDPERAAFSALRYDDRFVVDPAGRWWSLPAQLEGAVFTVAPTALERHHEVVLLRADLALVGRLLPKQRWDRPAGGPAVTTLAAALDLPQPWYWDRWRDEDPEAEVDLEAIRRAPPTAREELGDALADDLLGFLDELGERRGSDEDALRRLLDRRRNEDVIAGPPGWLPPLRPRDILALRIRDGAVHPAPVSRWSFDPLDEEAVIRVAGNVARELLEAEPGPAPSVPLADVLVRVAIEVPEVLQRPVPPFSGLLRRAGLDVAGGRVRPPGPARVEARWRLDPDREAPWGYEPGDRAA